MDTRRIRIERSGRFLLVSGAVPNTTNTETDRSEKCLNMNDRELVKMQMRAVLAELTEPCEFCGDHIREGEVSEHCCHEPEGCTCEREGCERRFFTEAATCLEEVDDSH